jgi:hypothetical protein
LAISFVRDDLISSYPGTLVLILVLKERLHNPCEENLPRNPYPTPGQYFPRSRFRPFLRKINHSPDGSGNPADAYVNYPANQKADERQRRATERQARDNYNRN